MRRGVVLWLAAFLAVGSLTCAPRDEKPPSDNRIANADGGVRPPHFNPDDLKARIESALAQIKKRELAPDHGFWTIFHAILGMGFDTELTVNEKDGRKTVKAIDYVFDGKPMPGLEFLITQHGLDVKQTGFTGGLPGFGQGHQDQFIAEMGQWGMPADRKVVVRKQSYTFRDFCNHSKMRASVNKDPNVKQELTWAIIVIGQYFGEGALGGNLYTKNAKGEIEYLPWENEKGETLNYEDIVRYEVTEPISGQGVACGGTHRLFGLSWAYHLHLRRGGKTTGVWQNVADKVEDHKRLAKRYQNPDGSFSTNWFSARGEGKGADPRIATTGHILEWLALALTDEELREEWVERAVAAQCLMVLETPVTAPLEGGGLYHATHGLNLYHARRFGGPNDARLAPVPLPPAKK
jgi:hypothetical protein